MHINGPQHRKLTEMPLGLERRWEAPASHPSGQPVPGQGMELPGAWAEKTCPDPRQWSFLVLVAQGLILIYSTGFGPPHRGLLTWNCEQSSHQTGSKHLPLNASLCLSDILSMQTFVLEIPLGPWSDLGAFRTLQNSAWKRACLELPGQCLSGAWVF